MKIWQSQGRRYETKTMKIIAEADTNGQGRGRQNGRGRGSSLDNKIGSVSNWLNALENQIDAQAGKRFTESDA